MSELETSGMSATSAVRIRFRKFVELRSRFELVRRKNIMAQIQDASVMIMLK